jgi:ATP-dependent Lhr-like helicase
MINGFYAKGRFIPKTFTDNEILSYVFRKQRVLPSLRYRTAEEAVADRGYIRTDAEMLARVAERIPLKKLAEHGTLVQMALIPGFQGYTTKEKASVYRMAKNVSPDEEMNILMRLIEDRQPVSRKEMMEHSPFSPEKTAEILGKLTHASFVCIDGGRRYVTVEKSGVDQRKALKAVIKGHFKCFGTFSAEQLYRFILSSRMGELRGALAELEDDGVLVKGFLRKDDPTVMWMLKEDIDKNIIPADEVFLLNTQDNLHVYIRDMIKQECGSSENVIISGTRIIGSFKGKLTVTGAKIDDLRGSDEAVKFVKDLSTALGVAPDRKKKEEDKDWDICEFYHKTHPGSIKK